MSKSTKEEVVETPEVEEAAPVQGPAAGQPGEDANLTIQDLTTAYQIIGVVSSRGAIKPEEMAVVGALYNKLQTFLEAAAAAQENQAAPAGE